MTPGRASSCWCQEGDRVEFAGEPDLTDYHSPLGAPRCARSQQLMPGLPAGTRSGPRQSPQGGGRRRHGLLPRCRADPDVEQHTLAAVLTLPETFDDYLAAIGKKERHELRRKRRKFEGEAGPSHIERRAGTEAVALFADLHRQSSGDKGEFMTEQIEEFFLALHTEAGGVIDVLVDGSDRRRVCNLLFRGRERVLPVQQRIQS